VEKLWFTYRPIHLPWCFATLSEASNWLSNSFLIGVGRSLKLVFKGSLRKYVNNSKLQIFLHWWWSFIPINLLVRFRECIAVLDNVIMIASEHVHNMDSSVQTKGLNNDFLINLRLEGLQSLLETLNCVYCRIGIASGIKILKLFIHDIWPVGSMPQGE